METTMPIAFLNNDRTPKNMGDFECPTCRNGRVFSKEQFVRDGPFDSHIAECGCNDCLTVFQFKKINPVGMKQIITPTTQPNLDRIKRRVKMSSFF